MLCALAVNVFCFYLIHQTEQNRFGRKTDEIAKFSTLDGKTEFTILDGIWMKNWEMAN